MSSRGVVISRKFDVDKEGHAIRWYPLNKEMLRWYALYWDKIDIPIGVIGDDPIMEEETTDLEILRQEGMLIHTQGHLFYRRDLSTSSEWVTSFSGENPRAFSVLSSVYAWEKHANANNGWEWSIESQAIPKSTPSEKISHYAFVEPHGKTGSVIALPNIYVDDTTGVVTGGPVIELIFHKVLVQPSADTPIEEILDFRVKRQAELEALRIGLGDLYQKVVSSGDPEHALKHEKEKLERTLNI